MGLLDTLARAPDPVSQSRLMRLHGSPDRAEPAVLRAGAEWQAASAAIAALIDTPELGLGDDSILA
jgi:hypothetical protein